MCKQVIWFCQLYVTAHCLLVIQGLSSGHARNRGKLSIHVLARRFREHIHISYKNHVAKATEIHKVVYMFSVWRYCVFFVIAKTLRF